MTPEEESWEAASSVWEIFDQSTPGRQELEANGFTTDWGFEVETNSDTVTWELMAQHPEWRRPTNRVNRLSMPRYETEVLQRVYADLLEPDFVPKMVTAVELGWEQLCCRVKAGEEVWRSLEGAWG